MPEAPAPRARRGDGGEDIYEKILDRIDHLSRDVRGEMQSLKEAIHRQIAELGVLANRMGSLETDRDRLIQEVFTGNGHPALVSRVTASEEKILSRREDLTQVASRIAGVEEMVERLHREGIGPERAAAAAIEDLRRQITTLATSVDDIRALGCEPSKTFGRQLDEHRNQNRWVIGTISSILFAVVAAVIGAVLQSVR